MMPSPANPAATKSLMAMKARKCLHLSAAEEALCFFAFFLSIFIYFSVFNLSLSTLFDDTKFWFCLSNTLVFIIAADCGAFSPPPSFNAASKIIPTLPQNDLNSVNPTQNEEQEILLTTDNSIPLKLNNHRKSYGRSKSEKVIKRVAEKGRKMAMRRSKTTTRNDVASEEKKNEFGEMTDEELNRRVEEFIERFNRQIRLQEIGDDNE